MREGSPIHDEKAIFAAYLRTNRLKRSEQREVVVDVFLRSDRHLSVEDLLRLVKRRRSDVGRTTVYRTLKLLTAAGLAQELEFAGHTRFEREHNRAHHDHFICTSCNEIFEFSNEAIERIQEEIAAGIGFRIETHRHHIYGVCAKCQAAQTEAARSAR